MSQQHTPLMVQYHAIKEQYRDTLLFFQVGDFYELFFDDAKKAASFLGITLTARGKNKGEPIPLCGVPVHAKDHYVTKLIKGGFNVAICEQLEPPVPGSVVKRGVTQVLTPGTLTDGALLDEKKASYLFSFFPLKDKIGLLFGELMTAQLFATILSADEQRSLESELSRFFPDEIVMPNSVLGKKFATRFKALGYCVTAVEYPEEELIDNPHADTWIEKQFGSDIADAVHEEDALKCAVYYFYAYVSRNQQAALSQFHQFHIYKPDDFLLLDSATQRNLELVKNNHDGSTKYTLFSVLDDAQTPMGSRLLRKWIVRPLITHQAITQRHDIVAHCVAHTDFTQKIQQLLKAVGDLERVVGRIALDRAAVHDYLALKHALQVAPSVVQLLIPHAALVLLQVIVQRCDNFDALRLLLSEAINDDTLKPWIIKEGFDDQLDHARDLVAHSNKKLSELEFAEQQSTGINSLKVRYNQVHGYYIEVTKPNIHLVPDHYIRRQTLVGKERFVTSKLQHLQYEIERAKHDIGVREREVFERIKKEVASYISALRKLAYALCNLDALLSLSLVARDNMYTRPSFNAEREFVIEDGKHPVIAQIMREQFIPNDTLLTDEQSLIILTGPNMGGKSTYLRQIALTSIMAQIGSFVPAKNASLPLVDRIFTRIGAGDNLAEGKSTFLVEMEETATICTQATKNSLVILDEVGRGTSTFDGLAIAQAVVEYVYTNIGARCLFATHYHELTHLEEKYSGIASYYAASTKSNAGIVFLYKIVQGIADGSFGIEVGRLAQLPAQVVTRARQVIGELQASSGTPGAHALAETNQKLIAENEQLRVRAATLEKRLSNINYDELSPKKAFDLLWELKEVVQK